MNSSLIESEKNREILPSKQEGSFKPEDDFLARRAEEDRQIKRVGLAALFTNIFLAGLKGALAILSGSLALTADALDSATDSMASLIVWIGLKLSTGKFKSFPYGLYKIENIISVIVAFFIFLAGVEIARKALQPLSSVPVITLPVLGGAAASVVICWLFSWYAKIIGKRTASPTLIAEAKHRQVDLLSSVLVLSSLISGYFGFNVDRFTAMAVLVFILYAGWELLSDGMRVLLDASLDAETLGQIRKIIESHPLVGQLQSLVGRNAGRYRFVEAVISLKTTDLQKAHLVSQKIEEAIRKKIPHVERILIHYEPSRRTHLLLAVPLTDTRGAVSPHFGEAPYFAFISLRLNDGVVEAHQILANPFSRIPKAKGMRVAEWLMEHKVDLTVVREPLRGKGPGYALSGSGVDIRITQSEDLQQVLETVRQEWVHSR